MIENEIKAIIKIHNVKIFKILFKSIKSNCPFNPIKSKDKLEQYPIIFMGL